MRHERLAAYRIMWIFVFFDLPVNSKKSIKAATKFRKDLIKDGFTMMQFSVYIRHCASDENAQVHIKRINSFLPANGSISILKVTDKQYGDILNFYGRETAQLPAVPRQLELL